MAPLAFEKMTSGIVAPALRCLLLALFLINTVSLADSTATESATVTTINDLKAWKHPTKAIFQKYKITLAKVELSEGKRYATFFVNLPFDPQTSPNESFYNKLYAELLKANGWWDYQLHDDQDQLNIRVHWNKSTHTLSTDIHPIEQ